MQKGANKLAIEGGKPVKTTPYGKGKKHSLAEWRAIRPLFIRGEIHMTRGPEVMELRRQFCRMHGMAYAVTVSSGTAALHTALGALQIGRGDEVITSPITDMGTLIAIMQLNAVPVFADVDPLTLMITPATVKAKFTKRTRAVLPVHLAGQACDIAGICRLARPRGIAVVEDLAQSYLARQKGRLAGTVGDVGCWSLNESKHIGAGDGGVLMTNDKALAERADLFADKCYDRTGSGKKPAFAPYNYRLNNLAAAVCLQQLKKVKWICERRHMLGTRLDRLLNKIDGVRPKPVPRGDYATYWYYIFHIDRRRLTTTPDDFSKAIRGEGVWGAPMSQSDILSWPVFANKPLDRHACGIHCPYYKGKVDYDARHFKGLQQAYATAIRLPMSEYYRKSDIDAMAEAIAKVAAYYRRR